MEENKQYKKYWYAVRILHNRVEACVELLDSINGNPKATLSLFLDLPEGWMEEEWQPVESYPRPEHISVRAGGKRINKYVPQISSLLFIHATASQIKILEQVFCTKARFYTRLGTKVLKKRLPSEAETESEDTELSTSEQTLEWHKEVIQPVKIPAHEKEILKEVIQPVKIPAHEIEILKVILSHGAEGVEQIPTEKLKWGKGTKVKVIAGEFKGWQGEIRRIKCKSRLVVSIRDVQQRAVAAFCVTTYIPFKFLEEITT